MFNTCGFNIVKYNSTCVVETITPSPVVTGGITIRKRVRKLLRYQDFRIVGKKLIFNSHPLIKVLPFLHLTSCFFCLVQFFHPNSPLRESEYGGH